MEGAGGSQDVYVMDPVATAALEREYCQNGYVVVRSLLDRERLLGLRSRAEVLLENDDPASNPHAVFTQKAFSRTGDLRFAKLSGLLDRDEEFADILSSDALVDIVELLVGRGARRFRDVLVVKPARTGGALSSHQDSAYWDVAPMSLVSAWIALGDVDESQSPLTLAPSTHHRLIEHGIFLKGRYEIPRAISRGLRWFVSRAGTGDNPRAAGGNFQLWKLKRHLLSTMTKHVPSLFDLQDFRLPPALVSTVRHVPIPVRAGDVIFFHSLVWHSSSPNAGDTARYAEIASFMSGESRVKGVSSANFPPARRKA